MLFCQIVASFVVHQHPEAATVERTVDKRDPKTVYIDCLQNIAGKTLACAYSARASDYAGASTPLAWDELGDRLDPRAFTIKTLPARLAEVGDLWAGLRQAPGIDLGGGARARAGAPPVGNARIAGRRAARGKSSRRQNRPRRRAHAFEDLALSVLMALSRCCGTAVARADDEDPAKGQLHARGGDQGAQRLRAAHRQDRDHPGDVHLRALRQAGADHRRQLRRPGPGPAPLEGPQERQVGEEAASTTGSSSTASSPAS